MIFELGEEVIVKDSKTKDTIIRIEDDIHLILKDKGKVSDCEIIKLGCDYCRFLGRPTYFDPCHECVISNFKNYEPKE